MRINNYEQLLAEAVGISPAASCLFVGGNQNYYSSQGNQAAVELVQ